MKGESPNHQLRFSIDLRSIKEHEFTAQLSLRYSAIPALGLSSFRSPSLPIPNARAEAALKDCFLSGYFQASMADVEQKLRHKLLIELWHCDRLKKDTLLGKASVEMKQILDMPLRTTTESFARVFDAYHPVDEVDENDKPLKTIGSLRVIAYLEDLGPADQLERKGFNIKQFLEDVPEDQVLPSRGQQNQVMNIESAGLNELERKVVWQLQTWKKAEETKARITLKHKEIQFWTNLSDQQRKSDLQKEKQFKKIEANLILLEGKLRSKGNDLNKREQKLMLLEQELQSKIGEVSRQVFIKDQEIEAIKRRHKEDKNSVIREKASIEVQLAKTRAQNAKFRVQIQQLKKQDQKSPLNILKAELNAKILEIKELSREVQKANEVKDQYKIYYGKMKEEVILLRDKLKHSEESFSQMRRQKDLISNNCRHLQQQLAYERQIYQQNMQRGTQNNYQGYRQDQQMDPTELNQREILMRQREHYINELNYPPSDRLIQQLDKQIRNLS